MSGSNKKKSKRQRLKSTVTKPVTKVGSAASTASKGVVSAVDSTVRSTELARLIAILEDQVNEARRDRKIGKGSLRSTYIEAYRGFVAGGEVRLRMRVMEEPVIPPEADKVSNVEIITANVRRVAALSFPGLTVRVSADGQTVENVSDRHGYVTVRLPATNPAPGWHEYTARHEDDHGQKAVASSEFLVPDPGCKTAIVSDIDDTILQTGLSEGFTSLVRTFTGNSETRSAVPGMADLYSKLAHEKVGSRTIERPFLYLSTGGWALYEMLQGFLNYQGFPKGVLFLTDWLPQERFVLRSGKAHKLQALRRILSESGTFQLVLIGDSGQEDAFTYTEIAAEHPGRIKAIVILNAGDHLEEKHEELRAATKQWHKDGIPFYLVDDSKEAEEVLTELGVIETTTGPKKKAPAKKTATKKTAVKKKAPAKKKSPAKKAPAKKASTKKTAPKRKS